MGWHTHRIMGWHTLHYGDYPKPQWGLVEVPGPVSGYLLASTEHFQVYRVRLWPSSSLVLDRVPIKQV